MLKILKNLTIVSVGLFVATTAQAANLLQSYHDALQNDAVFKKAEADMLATKENEPQALSQLLPQLSGGYIEDHTRVDSNQVNTTNPTFGSASFSQELRQVSFNISQTIFNYTQFKNFTGARASSKSASARYASSSQDLIQRVAQLYFAVLEALDLLRFDDANKRALYRQYLQAREQYKVGLKTVKDVYEVKSSYDDAVALFIADEKALADARENLRAVTGVQYGSISEIDKELRLVPPTPNDVNKWADTAVKNNFLLLADHFDVLSKKENIQAQFGQNLPTVTLQGASQDIRARYNTVSQQAISRSRSVDLNVNVPIFQGGLVNSSVRQARDQYYGTIATLENDYRTILSKTRQDFLGVIAAISKIAADKQAIISSEAALTASRAEFQVGTATMLDVLTQQSKLLRAQSAFAQDLYSYLNNTIKLKQDAGVLTVKDLAEINRFLIKETGTSRNPS